MNSLSKRVETYLSDKSEIVYVYPAVPSFIVFIVTMVSSSIYVTKNRSYSECLAQKPDENDYIGAYVLGSIICGYVFLAIYANILIEFVPKVKGLAISFFQLFLWTFGSFIWNIIGASLVSKSRCTDTSHYKIAVLNLVVFFVSILGLILYAIVVFVRSGSQPSTTNTQVAPQTPVTAGKTNVQPATKNV